MGICVIEETQLCVHTLARARWLAQSLTHTQKHTHSHILSPAGVLISPRGRVSVDPKTL